MERKGLLTLRSGSDEEERKKEKARTDLGINSKQRQREHVLPTSESGREGRRGGPVALRDVPFWTRLLGIESFLEALRLVLSLADL